MWVLNFGCHLSWSTWVTTLSKTPPDLWSWLSRSLVQPPRTKLCRTRSTARLWNRWLTTTTGAASVCVCAFKKVYTKWKANNPLWFFSLPPLLSSSLPGWVWSVGGSCCGCVQACSRPVMIWWDTLSASWQRGSEIRWLVTACRDRKRCAGQWQRGIMGLMSQDDSSIL